MLFFIGGFWLSRIARLFWCFIVKVRFSVTWEKAASPKGIEVTATVALRVILYLSDDFCADTRAGENLEQQRVGRFAVDEVDFTYSVVE